MRFRLCCDDAFSVSYLLAMAYGLSPANLLQFVRPPATYWAQNLAKLIFYSYMCDMDAAGGDPAFFGAISTAAHTRISRLMLHPNIICGVSADDERRDPLAWIMEACPGEDEGEEDVPTCSPAPVTS
ncbi:hypothetical protein METBISCDRAFT_25056 [Metschnikowia bicuspidata]|uniref:Uncharacterized protein n=1 Tax=Metschnikowia bicuspidata TaxID=27322 RepID=A0A4P9Z7L2_9ASCO|nr:hypothetical protein METBISCDRAFT_25056 [Metschnikowia bicuspidata]